MASLYAAAGRWAVAARSPYFIQLGAEPDTAPLVWGLDTLGRPVEGIASVREPSIPLLGQLVNAAAVAVDPAGDVYFAPLTRDEIRKYGRGGQLRWTARRGLPARDSEPGLLPGKGRSFAARYAIRSEEHTSELQSRLHLVCRLLLEKKKKSGIAPEEQR